MRKKFILGMAGIAAIAVTVIVTVSSVNARSTESDLLTTKNVEALTRYEGDGAHNTGDSVAQTYQCPEVKYDPISGRTYTTWYTAQGTSCQSSANICQMSNPCF